MYSRGKGCDEFCLFLACCKETSSSTFWGKEGGGGSLVFERKTLRGTAMISVADEKVRHYTGLRDDEVGVTLHSPFDLLEGILLCSNVILKATKNYTKNSIVGL